MILHLHIVHVERHKRCLDGLLNVRIGEYRLLDKASKPVLGYGGSDSCVNVGD